MKKSTLALASFALAILFGSGVLYSVGNESKRTEVKLPESQVEEFGLRTVADGKDCYCVKQSPSEDGSAQNPGGSFFQAYKNSDECEAKCEGLCQSRMRSMYHSYICK